MLIRKRSFNLRDQMKEYKPLVTWNGQIRVEKL